MVSTTTGRHIYRQSGDGYDGWNVARLVRLAHTLPVVDVALHKPGAIDINYWFEARQPTVRNVAQHVRHATHDEDSAVPVIPGPDNRVMDGLHRIARAVLDDPTRVRAVPPERLPAPAQVTWRSAVWELLRPLHADAPRPD